MMKLIMQPGQARQDAGEHDEGTGEDPHLNGPIAESSTSDSLQ